jgi:hypothetical protein
MSWRSCYTVKIDDRAREALILEAAALRDAMTDATLRTGYDELTHAIAAGEVDDRLLPPLERLLELGLRTGRVRRIHGPEAEAAAVRIYHATPKGRAIGAELAEVNQALGALRGRTLEGLSFTGKGPGAYAITIDTPSAKLTLEVGPEGVAVKDLSVGT